MNYRSKISRMSISTALWKRSLTNAMTTMMAISPFFSSFFSSYDAMNLILFVIWRNEWVLWGSKWVPEVVDRRRKSTVDGNDNFRRSPSPLVKGKLTLINLKYTCARIELFLQTNKWTNNMRLQFWHFQSVQHGSRSRNLQTQGYPERFFEASKIEPVILEQERPRWSH